MKITICAVGRMRKGPEAQMVAEYLKRFDGAGRQLGLGPATLEEIEVRPASAAAEAEQLEKRCPSRAIRVALDERGKLMSSPEFAKMLARFRDDGEAELAFLIGGADGLTPALRATCKTSLSFGSMVWPHLLARAMLTEQLYRAVTILSGSPYHRV